MDEEQVSTEYVTPEAGIITGTVAQRIQIAGRLAFTLGEIVACFALAAVSIVLFFLTQFMGFEGVWLGVRMLFIGGVAAFGRLLIFDRPGGMKYGDWLLLWWDYQSKRRSGRLTYDRPKLRRATVRRYVPPTQLKPELTHPTAAAPTPVQARTIQ